MCINYPMYVSTSKCAANSLNFMAWKCFVKNTVDSMFMAFMVQFTPKFDSCGFNLNFKGLPCGYMDAFINLMDYELYG